jgi:cold shock CspA family protein
MNYRLDREQVSELPPNQGKLLNMNATFGFVETGTARFFFHRSYWSGQNGFRSAKEGMIVEFDLGNNEKGVCAVNVRPITDIAMPKIEEDESSESELGAINALLKAHGFIALDRGGSIFFHRSACTAATKWKSLAEGDRVRFRVGKSSSGKKCAENVELYSGV